MRFTIIIYVLLLVCAESFHSRRADPVATLAVCVPVQQTPATTPMELWEILPQGQYAALSF